MSSGSYFPKAVKAVETSKENSGTRRLGLPTIHDGIVQMIAKLYVESIPERLFYMES